MTSNRPVLRSPSAAQCSSMLCEAAIALGRAGEQLTGEGSRRRVRGEREGVVVVVAGQGLQVVVDVGSAKARRMHSHDICLSTRRVQRAWIHDSTTCLARPSGLMHPRPLYHDDCRCPAPLPATC
jgi:hypothetical protein